MKTKKELQDKLKDLEQTLGGLQRIETIIRYEARIDLLKWTLGIED